MGTKQTSILLNAYCYLKDAIFRLLFLFNHIIPFLKKFSIDSGDKKKSKTKLPISCAKITEV